MNRTEIGKFGARNFLSIEAKNGFMEGRRDDARPSQRESSNGDQPPVNDGPETSPCAEPTGLTGIDIALAMALSTAPADAAVASQHSPSGPPELLSCRGIARQEAMLALEQIQVGASEKRAALQTKGMRIEVLAIATPNDGAANVRQIQLRHAVQLPIVRERHCEVRLTLLRSGQAAFSGAQVAAVMRVAQAARLVLQLETRALGSEAFAAGLWGVVNNLPFGLAITNCEGRTLFVNDSANELLQNRTDVTLRNGSIVFEGRGDAEWYHGAREELAAQRGEAGHVFMTRRTSGDPPVSVIMSNLPFAAPQGSASQAALTYLAFIEPDRTPLPDLDALRHLFGVTRTEGEIIRKVCAGMTPNDVAASMRMSVHTVRSYLKIIFSKMDVSRQADLVRVATWTCALLRPGQLAVRAGGRQSVRHSLAVPGAGKVSIAWSGS
jgi:DNA-binding CsgD family transcriptional regulator